MNDTPEDGKTAQDFPETKKYEALFTMTMPGQQKPQTYRIAVEADDPTIAMAMATDKWNNLVAPRDVRIREVIPKEDPKEG